MPILPYPTEEEILEAEAKGNVYDIIRWNHFLSPPQTPIEQHIIHLAAQVLSRMKKRWEGQH